jgi:L-threonylcarbamoyladenylate synthase
METRKQVLDSTTQADIALEVVEVEVLKGGGICIIPTDTIYGIVALEQFASSIRRIFEIKKRPASKPFIRLIGRSDALRQYTDQVLPGSIEKYWPGPLTLIFKARVEGTVAVRFPDAPFLAEVFSHLGTSGMVAPSANISGETDIYDCERLMETFEGFVDLIVCQRGGLRETKASTILDITREPWKVLRQGSLVIEERDLDTGQH